MKRLISAAVIVIALLLPGSAPAKPVEREIVTTDVTFQLSSASCPNLPPGTTINGAGKLTSVTWTRKRRGVTTITNSSVAPGTATDQAGNQYTFLYSNQFQISNRGPRSRIYRGFMIDLFTMEGSGPAGLQNGFLAKYTTNLAGDETLRPIDAFGDPIDFEAIEARCDPL